jgi:peptidoglycan/LPS O-acetylase OafA/YrhL
MTWEYRKNSLDALRLLAAMQVAYVHAREYLTPGTPPSVFTDIIALFPGVPIFFFISGFLITRSFERLQSIPEYARNRGLRIFPALWLCVALNIVMVASTGYLQTKGAGIGDLLTLFMAKATFLQFYNPTYMRDFGDGVLNGSLWTICVELQFYILTPILYKAMGLIRSRPMIVIGAVLLTSLLVNRILYLLQPEYGPQVWWKLIHVSFLPWIYMFLAGMFAQRNFETLAGFISKCPAWLALGSYIAIAYVLVMVFGLQAGNGCSPLLFILLIFLILRLAYANPALAHKALRGNDISYGLYIWHMPVVNQMLYFGLFGAASYLVLGLALSVALAVASWFLLEKPALRKKKSTLNEQIVLKAGQNRSS